MGKKRRKKQAQEKKIQPEVNYWPLLAFYLLFLLSALLPFARYKVDFIWSKIFLLNLFTTAGLILWLVRIVRDRSLRLPAAYTLFPLLFLSLAFLLSVVKAVNLYKSELTLAYQVGNFFLYLLILANFRDEQRIESIFLAMGGATISATIYGLLQFYEFSFIHF